MYSKILRPISWVRSCLCLLQRKKGSPQLVMGRRFGDFIPPSQYDIPIPRKLHLTYALKEYWEIIPLFIVTVVPVMICIGSIVSATKNKVDVVFAARSRDNISRTMDLRNPSVHKLFLINQRYEPWPEMQAVLDKMVVAERRALSRLESCSHP